jgi:endonuclease G, mitochondrial
MDRSKVRFSPDGSVPEPFRTTHRDYTGSGFDQGHLAPSADAESQDGLQATFLMTNISPQIGDGFNRTYWNRLERFVRRLRRHYDGMAETVCVH